MIITIFSLLVGATLAQEIQPKVIGQKELSTEEGKPITLQLTDLYVEETPVDSGDDEDVGGGNNDEDDGHGDSNNGEDGNSGPDDNGDDQEGDSDDDERDDEDNDEGKNEDHDGNDHGDEDHDDDDDRDEDRDDEDEDRDDEDEDRDDDDKGGKDKKEDKDNKDDNDGKGNKGGKGDKGKKDEKGDKGKKGDKGNKGNKSKGSNEGASYPDGYTLIILEGTDYTFTGTTILPAPGFSGILKVPLRVRNEKYASPIFTARITVIPAVSPKNVAPKITGQLPLSVSMNQSEKIMLSQLVVTDPDNEYPADFTLKVFAGANYSLDGNLVIPQRDFTGDLSVNVSVSDGIADSEIFPLKITVTPGANVKPVITGQSGLKIPQGENLEIKLSHLVVEDPDSRYPEDFTLIVSSGDNYAVSNRTVTPDQTFLGTLTVTVSVHDGKVASDPFDLKIQVISRDKLEIVGQKAITVPEDSSVIISLNDLVVNDPSNRYPQGFTINIRSGEHYKMKGNLFIPARDFFGNVTVPVTVAQGAVSSATFELLIVVQAVNDPPELINVPSDPIVVNGRGTWPVFPAVDVVDVDDEHMLFAEIGFGDGVFHAGRDKIGFNPVSNLRTVFDQSTGVLYAVGQGSLTEYRDLIQSITYEFNGSPDSLVAVPRYMYVKLNDGKSTSAEHERMLMFDSGVELEIPTAFTPNNDNANDTWEITPLQEGEQINTFIRVYDKKGNMVFESNGLQPAWDGHYNGSPLPADVYFYTIEMDLSYRKLSYKGVVSILR